MHASKPAMRYWVLPLLLGLGSCTNDPGDGKKGGVNGPSSGTFRVTLVAPTQISQGYTSVQGTVFDGPAPSSLVWKETAKSGDCRLMEPKAPFCDPACGSSALCVENNKCQAFPKVIGIGKVTAKGLKTKAGATTFTMDPVLGSYQPANGVIVDFPPCAEGDAVVFSASGDSTVSAFTVSAVGISPLEVLNKDITLADGKPVNLEWTPPKAAGKSAVSVRVDISHHGGIKGVIECEAPDNGNLEIAATLVDKLKALGVSGFPKIDIARKATGTNSEVHVDLVIESSVEKSLIIPGIISCSGDEECPDGQTCKPDLKCQ